jgi:hypothetical protein
LRPTYNWFWHKFVAEGKLVKMLQRGCTAVLMDEAFTLHPLLMSVLFRVCIQFGVVLVTVGEALQVNSL